MLDLSELFNPVHLENNDTIDDNSHLIHQNELPWKKIFKPGIKLPKTPEDWHTANEHFRSTLNFNNEINDINTHINLLQDEIYSYFQTSSRTHKDNTNDTVANRQ